MSDKAIERLVGRKIKRVYMSAAYLKFETDQGDLAFAVEGDCCSRSFFHDFIGVEKLTANGPVISAASVSLTEDDPRSKTDNSHDYEEIECYGYEIVTEDPQFGPVTAVFSFRNSSNGYYGGWMTSVESVPVGLPEIVKDVLSTDDLLEVIDA